jgi:hypothetical protein
MWIGAAGGNPPSDIRAPTLTAAVDEASAAAAEFYRGSPVRATAELQFMIFGRAKPVFDFEGPQLKVEGEPGRLTATDVRDHSVHFGAALEDLVASAGGNAAEPGDYAFSWNRAVRALLPDPAQDPP